MSKTPNYAAQFDEQPADELDDFKRVFGGVKVPKGLQPGSTALTALEWLRQTPNSLTIDVDLNEGEWFALIGAIEQIGKRYMWYLGDAMVYGIRREYGETEAQIVKLEEITNKSKSTLYDYQRTALRFENSERSEFLDFEQHRVIVGEFPDDTPEHRAERLRWLHIAETQDLSGRKLKAEIAKALLPAEVASVDPAGMVAADPPALSDENEDVEIVQRALSAPVKVYKKTMSTLTQYDTENRLQDVPRDDLYMLWLYVQDKWNKRRKMGG